MEDTIKTPQDTVEVVDIQFRPGQKVYFFSPNGLKLQARSEEHTSELQSR